MYHCKQKSSVETYAYVKSLKATLQVARSVSEHCSKTLKARIRAVRTVNLWGFRAVNVLQESRHTSPMTSLVRNAVASELLTKPAQTATEASLFAQTLFGFETTKRDMCIMRCL